MSSVGEYNTLAKIKKLAEGSLDRDRTVDRTIHHGQVTSADAAETESFVISEWRGFLGEASSRMLPCDICGPVTIRLTLAQPNVLVPKEAGQSIGTALTDSDAESAAAQLTYSVSNLRMTVDSIIPPAAYNAALRERLASGPIKINYKNYFGFSMSGVGSAFTHRFSASSHSIDNLWNVQRNSNYLTTGVVATQLTNNSTAGVGDSIVPNYFTFKTHDNAGASTLQWQVNNTPRPVYRAKLLEALVDLVGYGADKIGAKAAGSIISDRDWWHNGQGVVGYRLNCPTELGVACKSGFDTPEFRRVCNSACKASRRLRRVKIARPTCSLRRRKRFALKPASKSQSCTNSARQADCKISQHDWSSVADATTGSSAHAECRGSKRRTLPRIVQAPRAAEAYELHDAKSSDRLYWDLPATISNSTTFE